MGYDEDYQTGRGADSYFGKKRPLTPEEMRERAAKLKERAKRLEERAEALEKPDWVDQPLSEVISFQKVYNGRPYKWVALKVVNYKKWGGARWYLSQDPTSYHGGIEPMTWAQLCEFMGRGNRFWPMLEHSYFTSNETPKTAMQRDNIF
jgi:hypothetical protein